MKSVKSVNAEFTGFFVLIFFPFSRDIWYNRKNTQFLESIYIQELMLMSKNVLHAVHVLMPVSIMPESLMTIQNVFLRT